MLPFVSTALASAISIYSSLLPAELNTASEYCFQDSSAWQGPSLIMPEDTICFNSVGWGSTPDEQVVVSSTNFGDYTTKTIKF